MLLGFVRGLCADVSRKMLRSLTARTWVVEVGLVAADDVAWV